MLRLARYQTTFCLLGRKMTCLSLALANVHVDELGTLDAEKVELALRGHCLGQQSLSSACGSAINSFIHIDALVMLSLEDAPHE